MNSAHFTAWIAERVEELVAFGVPRETAESLLASLRCGAETAEAEARDDRQFMLDFKREGATRLAKIRGKSPQAIWKRRNQILSKPNSLLLVATPVDESSVA